MGEANKILNLFNGTLDLVGWTQLSRFVEQQPSPVPAATAAAWAAKLQRPRSSAVNGAQI